MNTEELFRNFPTLETERLLLRQLDIEKDAQTLFEDLYSNPEVVKYDGNRVFEVGNDGFNIEPTMKSKMELWQQAFWNKRVIVWGLELKTNRKLIGIRYCEFFSMGITHIECKLNKIYWNKGLMTEASNAIIDFLEFNNVRQIVTTINKTNTPAIKLDKKIGFKEVSFNDLYFSQEISFGESISLQGLLHKMQEPTQRIFVKPVINSNAFELFENSEVAKSKGDLRSCALLNLKALEFQPDFIHAINSLAWAKLEMGDPHGAIQEFNRLLKIKSNKFTALLGRSYAYSDLQNWNEAINDLDSYLKLQPNDSDTFVMLGNYLFQSRRFKESVVAYDQALRINPNDQEARQYKQSVMQYL